MNEQCRFFEWADADTTGTSSAVNNPSSLKRPLSNQGHNFGNRNENAPVTGNSASNWPLKIRPSSASSAGASSSTDQKSLVNSHIALDGDATNHQRTAPVIRFTITLEDAEHVSTFIRPSYAPAVKEAVRKFSASAVAAKKTSFGEEKVCIPIEKIIPFETYIQAQVGAELKYEVPRSVLNRLCNYHQLEKKRDHDGDIITRSLEELLPAKLCESLMQFQWYGVNFALKRGGRCLIGDDMGLGKTIQAIAIARVYVENWPLLIVCPSSLRLNWREELLRWLADDLEDEEIRVVMTGKDIEKSLLRVNIISYDLVRKVPEEFLRRCQCVIADESHYLKSGNAQRTKAVTPLLKSAKRALLLSGTPALSRPVELFAQVNAVSNTLFPSYNDYVTRYCNARQTYWGYDVSGSSHLDELHTILRGTLLIRRKKEEVLTQLPEKVRHVMWVETKAGPMKAVARKFQEFEQAKAAVEDADTPEQANALSMRVKGIQNELYALSADAKIDAVLEFCKDTAESGCKFIVFAHHAKVVNKLDQYIQTKLKLGLIRIDGNTPQGDRQALCKKFQADDNKYRVAVLSITAAGVGLTLTKATVVMFAELYWNPGTLLQAEDRAHRIGQRNSIFVNYLLAKKTLDESMWKTVRRKLTVVGQSLTGTAGRMEAEEGKKDDPNGSMGKREGKDIRNFFGKNKKDNCPADDNEVEEIVPTGVNPSSDSDVERVESASTTRPTKMGGKRERSGKTLVLDDAEEMFPIEVHQRKRAATNSNTASNYPFRENASSNIDADLALALKLQAQYDAELEG